MNERADLETDEKILACDLADEALEMASGVTEPRLRNFTTSANDPYCVDC